ncbi:peroxisomal sarcosine oxidase [Patella vulgata]|uniref:peroxisomal sarcosine oxidase n=1 Tax=Patella vulgata TaxID=6465 RepID=UPI0024A9B420|nr:peroxisomal sarcosine oxidase [Patella vulgata]
MSKEDIIYDVIVVGAGIEGSSTAYQLAKRGQSTLLLEQFLLPHSRGSSHGQTRINRRAYLQATYSAMMKQNAEEWNILEKECGEKLYNNCGTLVVSRPSMLEGVETRLNANKAPYRALTGPEMKSEFPNVTLPDDYVGIYDYQGGILFADKSLRAFQEQFKKYGGTLRDGEQVHDVIPGDIVILKTTTGNQFRGRNVVLALGPYTNNLLAKTGLQLPLQVVRIPIFYWKEKVAGMYSPDKFPCFIDETASEGESIYGLPSLEYPGLVKICLHAGPVVDPHKREDVDSTWVRERMMKYIAKTFPWLNPVPAIEETCIYTNSPDKHLFLDRHPKYENIIIAAGFSGHGFKLAPIVGKILSDLVQAKTPAFDMDWFKISRFDKGGENLSSKL